VQARVGVYCWRVIPVHSLTVCVWHAREWRGLFYSRSLLPITRGQVTGTMSTLFRQPVKNQWASVGGGPKIWGEKNY